MSVKEVAELSLWYVHFLLLCSATVSVCSRGCLCILDFPSLCLSYIMLKTSDIDKLSVYFKEAADCYLTEIKIQNRFSQEMSVKHLQYARVFPLSSLKCLVLALNRHFKPRIALTFISNSVLLYPFFYTCRKVWKPPYGVPWSPATRHSTELKNAPKIPTEKQSIC